MEAGHVQLGRRHGGFVFMAAGTYHGGARTKIQTCTENTTGDPKCTPILFFANIR
jgi:hypothetical protein